MRAASWTRTGLLLAALTRWVRSGFVVAVMSNLGGCQVLPQLPQTSQQSLARDLVAGAAGSFCAGALEWLKAEPLRDVRVKQERAAGVELVLRDVRDLPLPHLAIGKVWPLAVDGGEFLDDRRSRLADLPGIVEATVLAADLAYDIREGGRSSPIEAEPAEAAAVARELPDYVIQKLYIDDFSGFKAFALASRDGTHRVYAIAGTQVFTNRDYRDWASGLMMARPQFVADASLLLARDAADYAGDMEHGGEVFFTGQSQGAIVSQALGFLTQELLSDSAGPRGLLHVVTWGVTGATEPIVKMIERSRQGRGRDTWPPIERHWLLANAEHRVAMQVWKTLEARWFRLNEADIADHIDAVARQMHVIGYFFDIDPFARVGTFLGTPLVFPLELVLPQHCEPLVTELVLDVRIGDIGLELESHFLKGYRRAVQRGAVELARPARIEPRAWVLDLLPAGEGFGRVWLSNIYLTRLGNDPDNWRFCFASRRWMTDANRDCRRSYWPGCSPRQAEEVTDGAADTAGWCLATASADASDDAQDAPD